MTRSLRQTYLDPEVLQEIDHLKLRARRLADGVLAGLHRSPHHGGSVEFSEYVEYTPGHELRHIDWTVYGKTDKFYVKQFEDETNLEAYLIVDASGSMGFSGDSAPWTKLAFARHLSATLAYLLTNQGDAAGAMGFADSAGQLLPASSSRRQLDDLFHLIDGLQPDGKTDLNTALETIAQRARRRSLIMVFSDFLNTDEQTFNLLRILRSRDLDVAFFHLLDAAEQALPYEGLSVFEGMEGEGELLVDPDDIRHAYQKAFKDHCQALEKACRDTETGYVRSLTSAPIEAVCQRFLRRRR